eukprot:CAMPEP_0185575362 /NCGR_PEP_ID=MMETSP0434-20130131/6579_1 /TAXON_ID=626734 ORGANISM="Favella taraikaensis, Strain Fe Narragansett Bay" /NCGR_SAMPLE_ID=MMETSP0434 /ASSEMBLY_ACC=CAM_ASM_000379 /LENGTH=50 /DNA_ID=CAMNT_0028192223 /DNA_START=1148 /DNA_END=1300 /DNA_ORIENTATION=-
MRNPKPMKAFLAISPSSSSFGFFAGFTGLTSGSESAFVSGRVNEKLSEGT